MRQKNANLYNFFEAKTVKMAKQNQGFEFQVFGSKINKSKSMEANYDFDQILSRAFHPRTGKEYYLIKWTNYMISQSTWEPASNIEDPGQAVQKFLSMPGIKHIDWGIPKPWETNNPSKSLNGKCRKRKGPNFEKTIPWKKMKTKKIRKEVQSSIQKEKKKIQQRREDSKTEETNQKTMEEKAVQERKDIEKNRIFLEPKKLEDYSEDELNSSESQYSRIHNSPIPIKIESDNDST